MTLGRELLTIRRPSVSAPQKALVLNRIKHYTWVMFFCWTRLSSGSHVSRCQRLEEQTSEGNRFIWLYKFLGFWRVLPAAAAFWIEFW